jgi:hypothetical protein
MAAISCRNSSLVQMKGELIWTVLPRRSETGGQQAAVEHGVNLVLRANALTHQMSAPHGHPAQHLSALVRQPPA